MLENFLYLGVGVLVGLAGPTALSKIRNLFKK